jgi:hypothetical protein
VSPPLLRVCRGAPRDLGHDQGVELRDAIRAHLAASGVRRGIRRPGGGSVGMARDTARFFPHMAERLAGLARAAGVPVEALLGRPDRPDPAELAVLLAAAPERTGAGPLVLVAPAGVEDLWLRRSEPDNDYASLEIALSWRVPALGGVNERGLAVAGAWEEGARAEGRCAAPASLLVQDCLQRFDVVDKAVEWCVRRPAGGRFALLLADASGDVARVLVEGDARRVERAADAGVLLSAPAAKRGAIEKACAAESALDARGGVAALRRAGVVGATRFVLDPAGPRLGVRAADAIQPAWETVGPAG